MNWTIIKSSFNERIFKISYLILVGLPILIDVLNSLNHILNKDNKLPSSFLLIFYSSLLLTISYSIYKIFCPKPIQYYSDQNSYLEAEQDIKERSFPDKMKEIVIPHLTPAQRESKERILELDRLIRVESDQTKKEALETQLHKIVEPLYPGCIQRYLIKEWAILEKMNWFALTLCLLLNVVSLTMILVVFTNRALKVVNYTF